MKGIDVSSHQGIIDFCKVKNDGIDFVIIRMACGVNIDKDFFKNYHSAKANGLKVGAYIYTTANTVPKIISEVNAIKNFLKFQKIHFPYSAKDQKTGLAPGK